MSDQHAQPAVLTRVDRDGPTPASFSQARLWFADKMGRRGLEFVYPYALRMSGPLDVDALAGALDAVVARHETLRTTFTSRDGEPFQLVHEPFSLGLAVTPVEPGADESADAALDREIRAAVDLPFDLVRGPVLRARLFRLGAEEHVFLLVIHHIATDGWSMDVVFRELSTAYAALSAGNAPDFPPLPVQFADFASWERARFAAGEFAEDLKFWRAHLDGCPDVLALPLDRPRPDAQSFAGRCRSYEVPAESAAALGALAKESGASTHMVLLAAFQLLIARWSGRDDFIVGMPAANRETSETEELVGFFMNLLPLRARVDLAGTFRDLVAAARESSLDAYDHQGLSFDRLVEEIAPERTLAHNPLVQIAFNMEKQPQPAIDGVRVAALDVQPDITRYDLAVDYIVQPSGGLRFDFYYASDLFEQRSIDALAGRFAFLLRTVTARPDTPLAQLPVQDAEAEARTHALGAGAPSAGETVPVLERFRAAVAANPDAAAVIDGETTLSFAELDTRAEAIARLVTAHGVAADTVVGLCLPRSAGLLAAILGVLRAGAAYLPLDPGYPAERLAHMVRDSGAGLVLTADAGTEAEALADAAAVVPLDSAVPTDDTPLPTASAHTDDAPLPAPSAHPDRAAYIIYTSGSTGRPKGVQVGRRALAGLLAGLEQAGVIRAPGGRVGWNASPSFDASVQQWVRVCRGDTVVILDEDLRRSPERLAEAVAEQRLTDLDLTPSHAAHLLDPLAKMLAPGSSLRLWIGGEPLPAALWQKLSALSDTGVLEAVNVYGTTESAVDTTWALVAGAGEPHLGSALPGQQIRILDTALQPVAVGTPGELYVSGPSLARGYLGRPGLTASRFLPDPWASDGSRMYRTGDRARWTWDGRLEYLGRSDEQVKIRGYRIEPGEVESVLAELPDILDCAVVRREQDGEAVLAAFVRTTPDTPVKRLREHAETRLPEWMRPSTYTVLDDMPLTPAGKVDRRALTELKPSAPGTAEPAGPEQEAPLTATEELLIRICQEVLGVEGLRPTDHFFEAGGHSLLAIRVVARLKRQARLVIPMTAVFENPVLRDLAAYIEDTIRERLASS
ncbi:amino acid adenylation domain-containing protein [Streptomyces sp. NPDC042319]|uniref:non-ribosomal peptide synthetase n=1 Tax=Streptomyces sp. NPDC042319 TaxID=3154332 RepID=UPI00340C21F2